MPATQVNPAASRPQVVTVGITVLRRFRAALEHLAADDAAELLKDVAHLIASAEETAWRL